MTSVTPLPAIALVYFLYVAVTEGFTLVNVVLLLGAAALFVFSLKRPAKDESTDEPDHRPTSS